MFYKALHGLAAIAFPPHITRTLNTDMSNPMDTITSHDLQFQIPNTRIDTYKFSYFPRTIRMWNILPQHVVSPVDEGNEPSAEAFKRALQAQFLNGQMYVVTPKGIYDRPRLRSTHGAASVGPVY